MGVWNFIKGDDGKSDGFSIPDLARVNDRVEGARGLAKGKGRGKVTSISTNYGNEELTISWDNGTTSIHQQWEVDRTNR